MKPVVSESNSVPKLGFVFGLIVYNSKVNKESELYLSYIAIVKLTIADIHANSVCTKSRLESCL